MIVVAVLVSPWLWQVPINEIDFNARLEGPSLKHPFGTDDLGQDLFARMLYGGRISIAVGSHGDADRDRVRRDRRRRRRHVRGAASMPR